MNAKPIRVFYDINRMEPVDLISTIHIDDKNTRYLELTLLDHGSLLVLQGCTVKARFVATDKALLSDNVPCTVTADNTILVPIDAAAVQSMACDLRIEINIVSGTDVLTLPFPLWVRVRGSILGNAHVSPDSEGTVPELLKEVEEELKRVQGFITDDDVYEIMDGAFQGNSAFFPQLCFEQYFTANGSNYRLIYDDRDGERHVLFDFAQLPVAKGEKGDKGDAGADGYSPTVSTTNLDAQTLVTVTDNNGAHNFYVKDGSSVTNAVVDENGDLIISIQQKPTSSVHPAIHTLEVNAGHVVGAAGADGYSPTVSTTNLDAQTLVTVTDNNGAHNFYVKDGSSVTNAVVDENGDLIISIQQKPTSSVHPTIHTLEVNAGHVVGAVGAKGDKGDKGDPGNDYVLTAQDKSDIAALVLAQLPTTQGVQYGN